MQKPGCIQETGFTQDQKPGFLQLSRSESLDFALRNPVSSALLRKMQDLGLPKI